MADLPSNLISEAELLSRIVAKAGDGRKLTTSEKEAVVRYQAVLDEETAYTYVSSQLDLSREIGVDTKTIQRRIKSGRSPGKDRKGYCVEKWKQHISPDSERLGDYADIKVDAGNSAEIHQSLLRKANELHAKLERAEQNGDRDAIDIFERRWLAVSRAAKDYENLVQKHDLEIGETIRVAEMEEVEKFLIIVFLDSANRFLDEFSIVANECENVREIRKKAEPVFEAIFTSTFKKAVRGNKLDDRVLNIWKNALQFD